MKYRIFFILLVGIFFSSYIEKEENDDILLRGIWKFELDSKDQGEQNRWFEKVLNDEIRLPGTTDTNKKGSPNSKQNTSNLSRLYTYKGKAWYQKEIDVPKNWKGKENRRGGTSASGTGGGRGGEGRFFRNSSSGCLR
jgi:hypothetical protein